MRYNICGYCKSLDLKKPVTGQGIPHTHASVSTFSLSPPLRLLAFPQKPFTAHLNESQQSKLLIQDDAALFIADCAWRRNIVDNSLVSIILTIQYLSDRSSAAPRYEWGEE